MRFWLPVYISVLLFNPNKKPLGGYNRGNESSVRKNRFGE